MLAKLLGWPRFVAFLLTIGISLLSAYHIFPKPYNGAPHWPTHEHKYKVVNHEPSVNLTTAYDSSLAATQSIAIPFGHQSSSLQFSIPRPPHVKRDLDFKTAKCKGQAIFQRIKTAYADPSKGREFGNSDIDNGWSRSPPSKGLGLGDDWEDAFDQEITKGTKASPGDMTQITLRQDKYFKLDDGTEVKETFNEAAYEVYYSVSASTIIATNTDSPAHQVQRTYKTLSPNEVKQRVPPLNRLSDCLWAVWCDLTADKSENPDGQHVTTTVNRERAAKLRYLGRDNIINSDTK
ncbi:MAG: hypothetical protein Q9179_001165, partial [Wetmoreana sp. 5 TL-2023]